MECIDGLCEIEPGARAIPAFIRSADLSVLDVEVIGDSSICFKDAPVRARDDEGHYVADDINTDINEAYEPGKVRKVLKEFTKCYVIGGIVYIMVSGGFMDNNGVLTSKNTRANPLKDEQIDWYLTLGEACTSAEFTAANNKANEANNETI
jgi:hypothetical protein